MKRIGLCIMGIAALLAILFFIFQSQLIEEQTKRLALIASPTSVVESTYGSEVENVLETDILQADTSLLSSFGIGKISCAEIGLNTPILEGDTSELLKLGAGTMKPNQTLGEGNYALAGHNMTNRQLLFGSLQYASLGLTIHVEAYQKKADYIIQDIFEVSPNEVNVIEDTQGDGLLTLVTCTKYSNNRLIIRGKLEPNE